MNSLLLGARVKHIRGYYEVADFFNDERNRLLKKGKIEGTVIHITNTEQILILLDNGEIVGSHWEKIKVLKKGNSRSVIDKFQLMDIE